MRKSVDECGNQRRKHLKAQFRGIIGDVTEEEQLGLIPEGRYGKLCLQWKSGLFRGGNLILPHTTDCCEDKVGFPQGQAWAPSLGQRSAPLPRPFLPNTSCSVSGPKKSCTRVLRTEDSFLFVPSSFPSLLSLRSNQAFSLFFAGVSCNSAWFLAQFYSQADFEPLICLVSVSQVLGWQVCALKSSVGQGRRLITGLLQ